MVNDFFIIPCLATGDFPQNALSIYNQWGDEVFQAAPYQNDWRGTYKGEELPVGTYYYVISFGPGESPQSGFLVLER
ncbi:MAG: gliding motility-associated C-terminal domain-containing protein [Bacteroidota bacterium]